MRCLRSLLVRATVVAALLVALGGSPAAAGTPRPAPLTPIDPGYPQLLATPIDPGYPQ